MVSHIGKDGANSIMFTNEREPIVITGVEDMSVANKAFIYIASSLIALGVVLIVLRRRRQRASTHYYSRR